MVFRSFLFTFCRLSIIVEVGRYERREIMSYFNDDEKKKQGMQKRMDGYQVREDASPYVNALIAIALLVIAAFLLYLVFK